jgi:predicted enzyme related to lactoylglutathione lyase
MNAVGRESAGVQAVPLIKKVDAVTVPVPDLDAGLRFYSDRLGHPMRWRNDAIGQAGLGLPESDTEIVLTTQLAYEPSWLVASADAAAELVRAAGGRVISEPFDIPVGRVAVVADPFDNVLVLLDLSKGCYTTDEQGMVTGVSEVRAAQAAGDDQRSCRRASPDSAGFGIDTCDRILQDEWS